tara:strand:- start:19 stop:399 length:381 start_codon:yes stop_codon:yes gene_type:complete
MQELVSVKLNILTRDSKLLSLYFFGEYKMKKYILNGIEYDNHRQYQTAYNNLIRENIMRSYKKDLKDIPIKQPKRPKIKRYKVYDFKNGNPFNMSFIDVVLSTICFMLFLLTIALFTLPIDTTLHW